MVRAANLQDFNFIYRLYMHPQVNTYLLYENMDAESFRPIFENLLEQQVIFIYLSKKLATGMFKLIPHQHRSDHIVYLGGLAIDPSFAGRGEGQQMMHEIIDFATNRGFLRIELSVAVSNERAIRLYERMGFHKEGILKKYTHLKSEQRFIDEIMMALVF
jgi:putative acetyltransferase